MNSLTRLASVPLAILRGCAYEGTRPVPRWHNQIRGIAHVLSYNGEPSFYIQVHPEGLTLLYSVGNSEGVVEAFTDEPLFFDVLAVLAQKGRQSLGGRK